MSELSSQVNWPTVASVVTPDGVLTGAIVIEDGCVTRIEERQGEPQGWVVPGFVDIHCHGGGGHSLATGEAESARAARAFHLGRGTTSLVASLVSSPFDLMLKATEAYRPLVEEGTLAGIHFEGPYLAQSRCGAQNPQYLRDASVSELRQLVETGQGAVKMVTIAPERPGALEAIEFLASQGVVPSIGHTDATFEQTEEAIEAGAYAATHLFNAMRPFNHRDPGPIPALLDDGRVVAEIIADPVHLHPGTMRFAFNVSLPQWTVLVSDAMAATGLSDGDYELGGLEVTVKNGEARLTSDGSIAGSTITMLDAFRNAVNMAGQDVVSVSQMASATPAELLGLADVGTLEIGKRADAVWLGPDLELRGVMHRGQVQPLS
ncbi:N-acetylglucosamine-6-phosphate deacetylase [Natronoglycomyces albus]|uniref:N-acetylglucosamine-6-phosphate deacetylase n=1 Tax=Natronoglycomyces albus TaxID=2811108 RepID=A0A895XR66_9ACTN|nr:N-acetylglucosamine-6-phosphate deacetylase [Natronoglycomyces albus]QSB05655.1 N-acetylglucosamine-6-phosphate deacetylase [Natronoglycomyces albus]